MLDDLRIQRELKVLTCFLFDRSTGESQRSAEPCGQDQGGLWPGRRRMHPAAYHVDLRQRESVEA